MGYYIPSGGYARPVYVNVIDLHPFMDLSRYNVLDERFPTSEKAPNTLVQDGARF
jgi:hypothetical protein